MTTTERAMIEGTTGTGEDDVSYDCCEKCGKQGAKPGFAVAWCGSDDCPRKPAKFFLDIINNLPAPKVGLRVCEHCGCDTTEHKRHCDFCGEVS